MAHDEAISCSSRLPFCDNDVAKCLAATQVALRATMDYTKLTLAELRNGISDTKSAIHRCKEALDNLRQPKTVGLQAMADAITHLLPRLEQD